MSGLPGSAACERNKGPILAVLQEEFSASSRVLEIGSGTGQHAVYFAREMPHLVWQTSDVTANLTVIAAWLEHAGLANTPAPVPLDVETTDLTSLDAQNFDAVFSANTAHIMPIEAVAHLFGLAGRLLPVDGIFCLYGPFNFDGGFSSDSNAEFDASLRQRNAHMGIRDLGELDEFAAGSGLERVRLYAMPANNYVAVWTKRARAADAA